MHRHAASRHGTTLDDRVARTIGEATDPDAGNPHLALVFQDTTLDDYLTAAENLRFHAELSGVDPAIREERLGAVLEMVGLTDRRDDLVGDFSGGMKRRLEIARGLIHSPRVLFLDEPTVGLDPQTRAHIWEYINDLRRREQITIFLTTHSMDEAEHLRSDRDRRPRFARCHRQPGRPERCSAP